MGESSPANELSLSALLAGYMAERGLAQVQLAEASQVHKATLHRWLTGKSVRPYHRIGLLSVAASLDLTRGHTNRLLRAAGLPPLDAATRPTDPEEQALLARWFPRVRTNLPAELTSFVGRAAEIIDIALLLERDPVRLVTLTGPGGSGKTRLALRAANEALDAFPDGVFFVSLVAASDPGLVMPAIAESTGLRDLTNAAPRARLAAWLQSRRVLLVLDNLEHVIDCGADLTGLLRAAPGLTILATSRVPLHVSGEYEWPVRPFPLLDPAESRDELRASAAVDLFMQRAEAANHWRTLDDDLPAVAEICARLDGLPLAIELAAARTRERGLHALLADFPNPLDLAAAGPRDVPHHQQSLQATIEWSVRLLPEDARVLLARLAVFTGGWTEESAAAICSAEPLSTASVPLLLTVLRNANLIERTTTPSGGVRYRMLQTIREYARELLAEPEDERALRARHAARFLALAEASAPVFPEMSTGGWYERVDEDLDNIRAALDWVRTEAKPDALARFVAALWPYWHDYLRINEGRRWLDAALTQSAKLPLRLQASLLTGASALALRQNDYPTATEHGQAALAIWQELDDHRGQALALQFLGWVAYGMGEMPRAISTFEQMVAEWRLVGDPVGIGLALSHLGLTLSTADDPAAAAPYLQEAHQLFAAAQDEVGLARSANDRGIDALLRGDIVGAIALLREAVARVAARGISSALPSTLFYLGAALCFAGQLDESLACLSESLRLRQERDWLDDKFGLTLNLLGFAAVAHRRGEGLVAATLSGAAQSQVQASGVALAPAIQALYEREVGLVVAQTGPGSFAAAFATGSELTEAEAIALARTLPPRPMAGAASMR